MTTTPPSANDSGLNLDHLEALARAATPGRWMRLFGERTVYDRMEDGCRGNAIVRADLGYGLQDISNLDFIAAANPAAVLELIALARRTALANQPAPTVPDSFKARQDFLDWNRAKSDPAVKIGREYAVAEKLMELMANQPAQEQAEPDHASAPALLNVDELAALRRFQETCEDSDSGGYDVEKDMMKRLAAIGVIESKGFGRYQFTKFGDYIVARAAQQEPVAAPQQAAAPKPAHGHRDDYYLLANGRRLGLEPISRVRNMPNWVLAMELFATGSTSAHQLCRDAGVDPDSTTTQRATQLDGGQEGIESNG